MAHESKTDNRDRGEDRDDGGKARGIDWRLGGHLPLVLRVAWPVILVLGLLTVIGAIVVSIEATGHKQGLDQITATGQVRALVAEINVLAHNFEEVEEDARPEMVEAMSRVMASAEVAHGNLVKAANTEYSEFFGGDKRLERVDATLTFSFEQMEAGLSALSAPNEDVSPNFFGPPLTAADQIEASSRQYLLVLDHIDLHIANAAREKLLRLQILEAGAIAAAGLLLVLLALCVLRPSHHLISQQIDELKFSRSMLAQAMIASEKVALARERLLYALSHDVRTPLQTILLNVEMARERYGELGQSVEIDRVARSAQRVKALIDELLTTGAKLEETELTRIDIGVLTEEIASAHGAQASRRGLAIVTDVEPHLAPIVAREGALKRVLENLVTNAIKYTEEGGVTIRAHSKVFDDDRFVGIDVIDTGPGLTEQEVQEIFEERRRLNTTAEGHGFGLAIARRLVNEELHGELVVESCVGQGSTFSVIIPSVASPGFAPATWKPQHFLDRLRETHVFEDLVALVMDDVQVQDNIRQLGAQVVTLEDDDTDAVVERETAHLDEAHLVVFDADQLSDGGTSLCDQLRRHSFQGPLVGLYSDEMRVDRDALIRSGCDALLRKPADPVDLVEWLARALTARVTNDVEAA